MGSIGYLRMGLQCMEEQSRCLSVVHVRSWIAVPSHHTSSEPRNEHPSAPSPAAALSVLEASVDPCYCYEDTVGSVGQSKRLPHDHLHPSSCLNGSNLEWSLASSPPTGPTGTEPSNMKASRANGGEIPNLGWPLSYRTPTNHHKPQMQRSVAWKL